MARSSLLFVALCCGLVLAKQGSSKSERKPCPKEDIEGKFKMCMENDAVEDCKQRMEDQMRISCGEEMDETKLKMKQHQAAQELLAECKMKEDADDCANKFANMTGMERPKDAESAKLVDKFEADKGAISALGDELKGCQGAVEVCKEEAKRAMKNMTGKDMDDFEFELQLMKAGARKASAFIKGCMQNSTTEEEKEACFNSTEAKMEAAKASGKNISDIKDGDLRKFAREGAMTDMAEVMKACSGAAAKMTAKKACFKRPDLKDSIADAMGKDAAEVKDSSVREFLAKGAQNDVLMMLKNCNDSMMEKCAQQAKELRAEASGKRPDEISDDELEMDAKQAMLRELGDKMQACVEAAGENATKLESCKMSVKDDLKRSSISKRGKEPSKADVYMALMKAAEVEASEVAADCKGDRDECMDLLKTNAAKAMGKRKEDLTDVDVERLNKKGAMEAAKNAAEACYEAKQDDLEATCEDPFKKFMDGRKEMEPASERERDAMEKKMKTEFAKDMQKDVMAICFEKESKEMADACLENFTSKLDGVADELFKDADMSTKTAKMKRSKEDAAKELVGERYHVCMKAAETKADKDACKEDMEQKAEVAGIKEDAETVSKRYKSKSVADAVTSCNSSKRELCEGQIKEELKQAGMKDREFGMVKKLGAIKAAAETWASCKENATSTDEECAALASMTLSQVTGMADPWTNKTAMDVEKLGEALLNGITTVLRKLEEVGVEVGTSGSACGEAELAVLKTNLEDGAASFVVADLSNITVDLNGCDLVDMKARYMASVPTNGLNETVTGMFADVLAGLLDGADLTARRLGRRLATVTEAYADQTVKECAENDASCGVSETVTTTSTLDDTGTASFAPMQSMSQVICVGLAAWGLLA